MMHIGLRCEHPVSRVGGVSSPLLFSFGAGTVCCSLCWLKLNKLLSYVFTDMSLLAAGWSHVNRRE
jgi:hypothetical protein